jgi:hypothetical protein
MHTPRITAPAGKVLHESAVNTSKGSLTIANLATAQEQEFEK